MNEHKAIKKWNKSDRPREKLIEQGRRALNDAELMAILIGSGSRNESAVDLCRKILLGMDHDLNRLAKAEYRDLCAFKGMGMAKAVRLIAAMELGRRRNAQRQSEKPLLDTSSKVYHFIKHLYQDLEHEESWVLFLNAGNRLLRKELIGKGGIDYTPVDIKMILRIALEYRASSLILSHNHPSGTMKASKADIYLTDRLITAGKLFDIQVHDHIIFTDRGYLSFRDEGLME